MKKENYQAIIIANKPAAACMDAINHVNEWWTAGFEGKTSRVNDSFKVDFGKTFVDFRVIETHPGKKLVWLVTDCNIQGIKDKLEWKGTKVVWDLKPIKEGTEITMTHIGLVPEVECFDMCQTGWNFYVKTSLLKLLTEGNGLPDKRVEYSKASIS